MPINLGCNKLGVEQGGDFIRRYDLSSIFYKHRIVDKGNIPCRSMSESDTFGNSRMKHLKSILAVDSMLADKVNEALNGGMFPLVFGGDHSLSWGSISGVSSHYGTDIGCVYLDAHGDFNSAASSPSGNVHGMHMYYLMGFGEKKYVDFYRSGRKINPKNVYFLGTRSLDYGERMLAEREKLNILSTSAIHRIGVEKVFQQLDIAIAPLRHIHFSLDIDCMDPVYAPGTGVQEPNGLTVEEVVYLTERLLSTGKIVSMDLVEFNPFLDLYDRTLQVCVKLLKCIDNNLE